MKIPLRSMMLGLALVSMAAPVLADPPDWAPAYGRHGHDDGPGYAWARVERVDPIYARETYPVRREVCEQQPGTVVTQQRYHEGSGSTAGTVLGAVIGGALGNQVGHGDGRAAATIAGAVVGGAIGNNATRGPGYTTEERAYQPGYQQCQVQRGWRERERIVGYDVTYRYRGGYYHTRTDQPPGGRIRVRVGDDGYRHDR